MVNLRDHDLVFYHPGVRVQPVQMSHLPLQVADDGIRLIAERLRAGAVDVNRRRIIGMHGEDGRVAELGEDHALQIGVDFAHAVVVARRGHAIAARGRGRIADKMVAFVNRKDEQRVALVNSVGGEPVKELLEGTIVVLQLLGIVGFAGTIREVDVAGGPVRVMRIGDVGIGDRNAGLLHLGDPGQ